MARTKKHDAAQAKKILQTSINLKRAAKLYIANVLSDQYYGERIESGSNLLNKAIDYAKALGYRK